MQRQETVSSFFNTWDMLPLRLIYDRTYYKENQDQPKCSKTRLRIFPGKVQARIALIMNELKRGEQPRFYTYTHFGAQRLMNLEIAVLVHHWSQAMLNSVRTWIGNSLRVVKVLLLSFIIGYIWLAVLFTGCRLWADTELATGQCRLGGARNLWSKQPLAPPADWVGIPSGPPYVTRCGSEGWYKKGYFMESTIVCR